MATGRNQKGMNRRNHHDSLSQSGQQRRSQSSDPIGKLVNDFFKPPKPSRNSGGSPFGSRNGGRTGNKKPWGLG